MSTYTIWYNGQEAKERWDKSKPIKDVYEAESAVAAAKAFVIDHKGELYVHKVTKGNYYED